MLTQTKDDDIMAVSSYISFNPIRALGIQGARYIKPERMYAHLQEIRAADMLLFPRTWQVNGLVHALKKDIFPSPSTYHLGSDKVEMTRGLMAACPHMVPKTAIYPKGGIDFGALADQFGVPFVCKEIKSSSGMGVFRIDSESEFSAYAETAQILYVQELLTIDRDLRVVIIGDRVVSAYWRVGTGFHNNLSRGGTVVRENVPEFAVQNVLNLAKELDIDYAGFDIALAPEGMFILEFNPWFGTGGVPGHLSDLGAIIQAYLADRADKASGRLTA